MDDGELVYVSPAKEPHAELHAKLAALLAAHVAPAFKVLADVLTRVSHDTDIAPDASVLPIARDPVTGGRQLDYLTFEIATSQSLSFVAKRARKFSARGVRRAFVIHVAKRSSQSRMYEWSTTRDDWEPLPPDGVIVDPSLAVPLPIRPVIEAVTSDDAVVAAYQARRHPRFVAERAAMLRRMVFAKFGPLTEAHEERLAEATDEELDRYADQFPAAETASAVFEGR